MKPIRLLELFAGIGAQYQALENTGIPFESVGISEIDNMANLAYELLHGKTTNFGDITKINPNDLPDCDLLTYSFPCQDISYNGKKRGFDRESGTRSSLLWECEKIIRVKKPKYLVMENVKALVGRRNIEGFTKWLNLLKEIGYNNHYKVLNTIDYGIPQGRERVFAVSIRKDIPNNFMFPTPFPLSYCLNDFLDSTFDESLLIDKEIVPAATKIHRNGIILVAEVKDMVFDQQKSIYSPKGTCPTLCTRNPPKILLEDGRVRQLSNKECMRLMGWKDFQYDLVKDKIGSYSLNKLAANSIVIPVLEKLFINLLKENYDN